MKRLLVPLVAVASLVQATVNAANLETTGDVPNWSTADCPVACVVVNNPGGFIDAFRRAAQQIKREGRILVIDGECTSACTMAADIARPSVCITDRARFRFHRSYTYDNKGRFTGRGDPSGEYSKDIVDWVRDHGGFPGKTKNDNSLLDMNAEEASRFFKRCAV